MFRCGNLVSAVCLSVVHLDLFDWTFVPFST